MSSGAIRAGRAFVELFADKSKLVAGLKSAEADVRKYGAQVKQIGMSMLLVSTALAAPFAVSAKVFADYSDKMSQVRAITNASLKDFERLNATAKNLGATTSFSASQVAEGMTYLGMAGFNTEQILAGIPAVLNLARAGAIDLGMAADIASDVGSAFGLAADQIGHIADVMAVTASSANTSISMMGETLKYAAPLAKAAGQSLEDTATAIGVLGNSGIKASMAGTDLALIMKLIGGDAKEAMAAIGVSSVDAEGNIRSVVDVMKELGAATKDMTQEERLKFFADNFDRAAKSAIILSDAGDSLDDLRNKIGNAEGAAAKMANTMDDNMGGSFRAFMSAIEGVEIALGNALEPTIRAVSGVLADLAGYVKKFIDNHQTLVTVVGVSIASIATLGAVLITVGTVAQATAVAMAGLRMAALAAGVAFGKLNVQSLAFLANPIVLTVTAITVALVAMSYAIDSAASYTAKLTSRMAEARSAGDKQRESSQLLMQRLEQLASKERLTNDEMAEAKSIIAQLNDEWGDLGVTVNDVTGKIEGMAGGVRALLSEMRQRTADELNKEIAETGKNIDELKKQMEASQGWFNTQTPLAFAKELLGVGATAEVEETAAKLKDEHEKWRAAVKRLNALNGGDQAALTGGTAAKPEDITAENIAKHIENMTKVREDAARAEERWAQLEEQEAAKRRSHLEQELHAITELAKERRKLNEQRIAGEKARKGGARQDVLDQLEQDKQRIDLEEATAIQDSHAREEQAKQREINELATERELAQQAIDDEVARMEIELNPDLTDLEKQLKLLDLDFQNEMIAALQQGADPASIIKKFDLQKQLAERSASVENAAEQATAGSTTGSFSALAAVRGMQASSAQDRTAKATEETAKNTKRIAETQKAQELRFS